MAVAVYGLLKRDDKVLLMRRAGSGYHDGELSLPAGHLDGGEDAVSGLVRELREELTIDVTRENCELATTLHRAPEYDGDYEIIDLIFNVQRWAGTATIGELDKCTELVWAPLGDLPEDVIPYIRRAIVAANAKEPFVLLGWAKGAPFIAETIVSARLTLTPLRVDDAEEMAPLLGDTALHAYTGGVPASLNELRERYRRQVVGHSPDGSQRWFNWIVHERQPGAAANPRHPVGTVQATVVDETVRVVAEVAWVIAAAYQGNGFATEASHAMVAWLRANGVDHVVAHIHPHHEVSMAVARSLGLHPTDTVLNGEIRWEAT